MFQEVFAATAAEPSSEDPEEEYITARRELKPVSSLQTTESFVNFADTTNVSR